MKFVDITKDNYNDYHRLMVDYYRDGEDADTPQDVLDDFINMMFEKITNKELSGKLVIYQDTYIGFVLWLIDKADDFANEIKGYGVIAEIGLDKQYRNKGLGKELVKYAEEQMLKQGAHGYYITAYGPAEKFWTSCNYVNTGKISEDIGLPIYVKELNTK